MAQPNTTLLQAPTLAGQTTAWMPAKDLYDRHMAFMDHYRDSDKGTEVGLLNLALGTEIMNILMLQLFGLIFFIVGLILIVIGVVVQYVNSSPTFICMWVVGLIMAVGGLGAMGYAAYVASRASRSLSK